ncbi:MAG: transketolase [Eubacteriales bacterium]|nr:transketolase [Eubacteriales bacterium]
MLIQKSVNAIRILSAEQVEAANSGHPGLPLGAAPMAYALWTQVMHHVPDKPKWLNRDRFILSAGHGSAMLYALLHLCGYDLSIDDLKNFRQLNSRTAGHPEYGHTPGVEATTGPLGAGAAMAVGMALAEAHLAERFNRPDLAIFDHHVYTLVGDGCLQEGITHEAFSFAGTQKLDKLIVLYDSNQITIEGSTDLAFTEDVAKRMEAYGFQVLELSDGNDVEAITSALEAAKAEVNRPSFIIVKTKIGYGSAVEGSADAHGAPLGAENLRGLRENLAWNEAEFTVPEEVYAHYHEMMEKNSRLMAEWEELYAKYKAAYPELAAELESFTKEITESDFPEEFWKRNSKAEASRSISGRVLNELAQIFPQIIGGSADLGPSNKSVLKDIAYFSPEERAGRNIHFGVREMAMTAIANGISLYGGLRPYVATFLVFSDYMKPMIRLSGLMKQGLAMILTHDSIGVGEDGPTHEPVEQLTMLRATPNVNVWRPADEIEVRAAWVSALVERETPTALALSRQNLMNLEHSSKAALKGGYIYARESSDLELIIVATGSELALAIEAKAELGSGVRVVSMPCIEVFNAQSPEYREEVLPEACRRRVVIEAGSSLSWGRIIGLDGLYITMDGFGASAPGDVLMEVFGFTTEQVVERIKNEL